MRHKRRLNKRKILMTLILVFLLMTLPNWLYERLWYSDYNEYTIIKEDINLDYCGKGQEIVNGHSGYFTVFHCQNDKTYIEYKQNCGPWKNKKYWQDTMQESGCGITAMAIIFSGYGIEQTPESLREKYYPHLDGGQMSQELNKTGIKNSDFYFDKVHLSKTSIKTHLLSNRPVLVCVWNKPNKNRWTTTSHYMVLLACSADKVYVSNPNGGKNDSNSSGWYRFSEIEPYIAKAMYIESY